LLHQWAVERTETAKLHAELVESLPHGRIGQRAVNRAVKLFVERLLQGEHLHIVSVVLECPGVKRSLVGERLLLAADSLSTAEPLLILHNLVSVLHGPLIVEILPLQVLTLLVQPLLITGLGSLRLVVLLNPIVTRLSLAAKNGALILRLHVPTLQTLIESLPGLSKGRVQLIELVVIQAELLPHARVREERILASASVRHPAPGTLRRIIAINT
jgi:hypothetical protein